MPGPNLQWFSQNNFKTLWFFQMSFGRPSGHHYSWGEAPGLLRNGPREGAGNEFVLIFGEVKLGEIWDDDGSEATKFRLIHVNMTYHSDVVWTWFLVVGDGLAMVSLHFSNAKLARRVTKQFRVRLGPQWLHNWKLWNKTRMFTF